MFRNPNVLGPTGTATDDMARFLAEPNWVLEPRKVDVIEIILTDEAFAIGACLVSPTRGDHEVMNLLLGLVSL